MGVDRIRENELVPGVGSVDDRLGGERACAALEASFSSAAGAVLERGPADGVLLVSGRPETDYGGDTASGRTGR
jgi:hypothetical protein